MSLSRTVEAPAAADWWRSAVVYQLYIRSFADANGDGVGDIAGVRARLGHLRDLGVDAVWFSPWYPSPMADAGYDVADYRDIDPMFGTLTEAEQLIREAHDLGLRIIVDVVPNHCSSVAESASVRATTSVGTPIMSAASRAASSVRMNWPVGTSTLPPRCPHFLAEES